MLPESHYYKEKADRAVKFIEMLPHTKAEWEGEPFWLLPWQERIIRDLFGIVREDGTRQFRTAYIEIPKKQGKSELAAAIALYLLYADNEPSAEVFSAAADRQQASIVYDVGKRMVEMTPALMKRSKIMGATKRIVNYGNAGYYQVVSAEVGGKHGYSLPLIILVIQNVRHMYFTHLFPFSAYNPAFFYAGKEGDMQKKRQRFMQKGASHGSCIFGRSKRVSSGGYSG